MKNALADMRTISKMTSSAARSLAKRTGLKNVSDWSAGELAHAIVRKSYGEKVYKAARKEFFK